MYLNVICIFYRNRDFRPSYGCILELRALVPEGTPLLACTATVSHGTCKEVIESLEMNDCEHISRSPNSLYKVHARSDIDTDMEHVVMSLKKQKNLPHLVRRSLDICAELYANFHYELGDQSYCSPGADRVSDNYIFGMFHASTPQHNKDVILSSLFKPDRVVRVMFATVALGMGSICGTPTLSSIMEHHPVLRGYFQKSRRGHRSSMLDCVLETS